MSHKKKPAKSSLVQVKDPYVDESIYYDDTGERWVTFMNTYGRDPHPGYHDPHYMAREDFKKYVDAQNGYKEASFLQLDKSKKKMKKARGNRDYNSVMDDDVDRWAYWRNGKDPNPGYHDVHYMLRPDFNTSTLQWPRTFA